MSANLLSLNQSKTEFLLIGLPAQLSKVSDPFLLMPSNVTIIPAFPLLTIATSLIHSKLDYYNFLFLNLPQSQLGRLQLIPQLELYLKLLNLLTSLQLLNLFTGSKLSSASNIKLLL